MDDKHERNMNWHEDYVYGLVAGEETFAKNKDKDEIDLSYRSPGYVAGFQDGYKKAETESKTDVSLDESKHRSI